MSKFRVTAEALNVRKQPAIGNNIIGTLNRDDLVDRIDVSADRYWYKVTRDGGPEGWASHKYLMPVQPAGEEPNWLTIARGELGVKEFPGEHQNNPRIVSYLRSTTLPAPSSSRDSTHWCSGFVNWVMQKAGYAGTDSAWARSWLGWGSRLDRPRLGCIAVFSRGEQSGHVAFYLGEDASQVRILGGNQNDAVTISVYAKNKLLGYRVP